MSEDLIQAPAPTDKPSGDHPGSETAAQVAELICMRLGVRSSAIENEVEKFVATALAEAVAAETERCAKIAENPGFIMAQDTEWDEGVEFAKAFVAIAIRSRSRGDVK